MIKKKLFSHGIRNNFLLLALLPTIILSVILSTYFIKIRMQSVQQGLLNRGIATAIRLASTSEYGIFAGDVLYLQDLTRKEFNDTKYPEELKSVVYYNKTGIEIYHYGSYNRKFVLPEKESQNGYYISNYPKFVSFLVPITIRSVLIEDNIDSEDYIGDNDLEQTTIIGWLKLELDKQITTRLERKILINSIIIVLFGLFISGYIAIRIADKVISPILSITDTVKKIQKGDLTAKSNSDAKWELKILEDGINSMAQSLQISHTEMQHNIEQATADLRHTLETIEIQNIELEIARQEAENSNKIKSEFLASISHELRTPLNGIIGFLNLLKRTDLSIKQKEYLSIIERSAKTLLSIISELLDLSRIEAGKLKIENVEMNIIDCIEDSLTLLAPSAHEKGIELVMYVYSDVPEMIIADPLRIKQIVTNLVNNAIKFTEEGSVIIRVMLDDSYQREKATIRINVSDTGIGLTQEEQKEIFKAFYRVGKSAKKISGTGLGLLICKKIIDHMHGKIGVDSRPDQGSTFWVTLDVRTCQEPVKNQNHFENNKVLVFEQHEIACLATSNLLSYHGLNVNIIQDESEIISEIEFAHKKNKPYSVLVLGIGDPEFNKILLQNTINTLKNNLALNIGIIVSLNSTDYILHENILSLGADVCLPKPLQRENLLAALVQIINKPKPEAQKIPKILLVDDNKENIKLLQVLLESTGIKTKSAYDGLEALDIIKQEDFDIIFMDIHMPKMDGIEATKCIRKISDKKDIPIIAITAHAQAWERKLLLQAGINDYLTKPIYEHELHSILNKWTNSNIKVQPIKKIRTNKKIQSSINWELGKKVAGNNTKLAEEMMKMLIESLPKEQEKIKNAHEQKDYKLLKQLLHKLHGACCYCGVPKLKYIIKSFEILLEKEINKENINEQFCLFNKEIKLILNEYNQSKLNLEIV